MNMDKIRKLRDTVKNIERLGRWEKRFLRFRYNVQIDTVAAQIAKRMSKYYGFQGLSDLDPGKTEMKTLFKKLKNAPEEFMASLEMVEFLTRAMDGYEDLGTAHQYIFQPIRDAHIVIGGSDAGDSQIIVTDMDGNIYTWGSALNRKRKVRHNHRER